MGGTASPDRISMFRDGAGHPATSSVELKVAMDLSIPAVYSACAWCRCRRKSQDVANVLDQSVTQQCGIDDSEQSVAIQDGPLAFCRVGRPRPGWPVSM